MQLAIVLPKYSPLPLYKQLSNALREAILTGRLQPGDPLPSTRELASSLDISRLTVKRALDDIVGQGYVNTIQGSGTYVSKGFWSLSNTAETTQSGQNSLSQQTPIPLSPFGQNVMLSFEKGTSLKNLSRESSTAFPWDLLPLHRWRAMLHKASRLEDADQAVLSSENDPFGYLPLRNALVGYLKRARSIRCEPEQVVVFPTLNGGVDLILRILSEAGQVVAAENPGNVQFREIAQLHGLGLFPIDVDDEGIIVKKLDDSIDKIRIVHITPSHQDPTGITLSLERRLQLLDWADRAGAMILEDDVDSSFSYGARLLPAVASLDSNDSVIYKFSFCDSMYPLVQFSFMVLPRRLVNIVRQAKLLLEPEIPLLEQRALTEFIDEGHLERHIKRSHAHLAKRRATTIHNITRQLQGQATVQSQSAGLHLVVNFAENYSVDQIMQSAKIAEIELTSINPNYFSESPSREFLMRFSHLDEEEVSEKITRFADQLKSSNKVVETTVSKVDVFYAPTPIPTAVYNGGAAGY